MLEKVKKVFAVLGACFLSVIVTLFLRGRSDGRGSGGNASGDGRVEEGLGELKEEIGRLREETERAEGHIGRAEEILRGAVERSKKREN